MVDIKVATQRAEARIGSVIKDRWHLDRLLGVGGMACVYAATHRNKKRAAVKMLHHELSSDSAIRERFLREGYLANSVGHRGAVAVDDDDVAEDGSAYLVMELLDGETLEQRWRRKQQRLPLEEVLAVGDQVLDTLAAAHEKGVVHRDLKPENLFLTRDGVVKLLDFGIGRVSGLKGLPSTTLSGAAMGTPAFMAPEQARGRWDDVDGQTDVWALGATLFTLLTGQYVHEAQTVNETLALAVTQPARSIKTLRPDLPAGAIALIDKALSYGKPQRYADARTMQAELRVLYAQLSGQDVSHAARLSVPDLEPSMPGIRIAEDTDPRLRMTTGRGVSASELPVAARARMALQRPPPWALAVGGAVLLLVIGIVARSCAGTDEEIAAGAPPDASVIAQAATVPTPLPSVRVQEAPSAVPQVSIEELPREKRKKIGGTGATTPAKKEDPFARRR
jgi:serine/threonine-protein kinase